MNDVVLKAKNVTVSWNVLLCVCVCLFAAFVPLFVAFSWTIDSNKASQCLWTTPQPLQRVTLINNETWNNQVIQNINNETWNHQVIKNINNETWNDQVIKNIFSM